MWCRDSQGRGLAGSVLTSRVCLSHLTSRSNGHAVLARVLKWFLVVKNRVFWACAHLCSCYCKGVTLRSCAKVLKAISGETGCGIGTSLTTG